jgi:1,2-diacylglycerol-3-alpha-glucose alpha-1,2-glucosyltransferase
MKVLLYTEGIEQIGKSGLGKAIKHQMKALKYAGVEYTLDPDDDYDIVHINTYGPKSFALAQSARKNGKRVVYHAHSTEEDFKNSFILSNQVAPIFKKWITTCYKLGDHIITPTPYSKKILDGYKMGREITAISNGIEIDRFTKSKVKASEFRNKYGYKKKDKVVMAIGLYLERKGILDFVELAKKLPQYKFIWFGYTPLYTVPEKIRKAVKTELPNLIFAGYVEQDMIISAMNGADLYIFPTLEETEGIPILEACACRQKAIVRDIPVFDDWLIDGVNVYKAKDIDEFERKIKKVLEGTLPDLTEEAYKVACSRDLKIIGERLKEVYEKVLSSPSIKKRIRKTKD